jgi:hypothetical protein
MTDIKELKDMVRTAIVEMNVRKWRGMDNIHEIADDPTAVSRQNPRSRDTGAADDLYPSIGDEKETGVTSSTYEKKPGELTPEGKAALKMNTIWTNNVAQIMNFRKGQELSALIAKRLEDQTGMPASQMLPIVTAIMRATLEQLDDEVAQEIEKSMPGVLNFTRS